MKAKKTKEKKGCRGCLITFVALVIMFIAVVIGMVFITGGNNTKQDTTAIATLNGYCENVANTMTLELGMVINGECKKEGEARFYVTSDMTLKQMEVLYNYDRDSLRQIWTDIATATRNYCNEKGFTAIDEITVLLMSTDTGHGVGMVTNSTSMY